MNNRSKDDDGVEHIFKNDPLYCNGIAAAFLLFSLPILIIQHAAMQDFLILVLGTGGVWQVLLWFFRNNIYFIGETSFGCKGVFGTKSVRYDEVKSIKLWWGRDGTRAEFSCVDRTINLTIDVLTNSDWWTELKPRLVSKGIPIDSGSSSL